MKTLISMTKLATALLATAMIAAAQPLNPATIVQTLTQPPTDSWPTYNGDYSGRRFSPLTQINKGNVKNLNLAWTRRYTAAQGGVTIKATPLMVNGVLYFSAPDNAWAVDALTGREIWHYRYEGGGLHIGNRGFGMYGNWLYFETPDCHIFSLDARTGEERWRHEIANANREYFCTPAPLVIGNHIITGVGGDSLDLPGYLESRDPETGEVQWRFNTTPRGPGDPGAETWPDLKSSSYGGGMTWLSGTYDPELNLYYFGTGNPQPVMAAQNREGDNLYTASIIALNPDTGQMRWHFQASPHDTHDWDNVATPVLIDGDFNGRQRKMLAQVSRNGYFHLLDRETGEKLVTAPFVGALNWASHINEKGQPIPDPAKDPSTDGVLVAPSSNGAANYFPPTFSPQTGLFYTIATESWAVYWKTDVADQAEGWGGRDNTAWTQNLLQAIDYKTGLVKWSHRFPAQGGGRAGLLSTAGGLVFGGDPQGSAIALDDTTGEILWHAGMHSSLANGPITYTLEGRQYVVFGAGDMLYAFTLPE